MIERSVTAEVPLSSFATSCRGKEVTTLSPLKATQPPSTEAESMEFVVAIGLRITQRLIP
ncbi:hypothetical protein V6Z12_A13G172700 [Gossypium hirsutum]